MRKPQKIDDDLSSQLDQEYPWPNIGDKLFAENKPVFTAYLPSEPNERLHHLTNGYKLAADTLAQQTEENPWMRNKLVYPIIFCYRHFLELSLKKFLNDYGHMAGIEPNWHHHRLEELWVNFKVLLNKIPGVENDEGATNAVENCIVEFAKIDPISETFRYPTNRKGKRFDADFERFDLLALANTIQSVEIYFMCAEETFNQANS